MLNPILVSLSSIYCFGRRSRLGGCVRNLFPAKSSFLFYFILFRLGFLISSFHPSPPVIFFSLILFFSFLLPFFLIFIFLEFTCYFYFFALSLSTSRSIFNSFFLLLIH